MFNHVVVLASLLAVSQAGLLLGGGLGGIGGYGLGGGLGGGVSLIGGGGYALGGKGAVDYYAPPKYEYVLAVHDPHTGDLKEKVESRIGDLTKTQYSWAEPDRKVAEARVIATSGVVQGHW